MELTPSAANQLDRNLESLRKNVEVEAEALAKSEGCDEITTRFLHVAWRRIVSRWALRNID